MTVEELARIVVDACEAQGMSYWFKELTLSTWNMSASGAENMAARNVSTKYWQNCRIFRVFA
jgi:hypothetical protein